MKRLVTIAFSDLHCNLWGKFNTDNSRTMVHFKVLEYIFKACKKNKIKSVLFLGDFFHKPENIDNELLDILTMELIRLSKYNITIYCISGNHDMKLTNRVDKPSPSLLVSLSRIVPMIKVIDFSMITLKNINIYGVPYIDMNIGLDKYISDIKLVPNYKNILLLHTDYPGAKDTDGIEIGSVENLNINLLNKFNLTLIGHIHKPQRLSKKVYMIGATHQQRRTDKNSELGYWEIYDDLSMKFISLTKKLPKFIDVSSDDDIIDDGNYYTVINDKPIEVSNNGNTIKTHMSSKLLVRKYFKHIGLRDKEKKQMLVKILERVKND